jgi:anti-anti-sigma factor
VGELGHDSAVALEAEIDALCGSGIDELLLDLGGLRAIDATGLRVITLRCALCKGRGVRVQVRRVDGAVREAFVAAGLLDWLPLADGEAAADENPPRNAPKFV